MRQDIYLQESDAESIKLLEGAFGIANPTHIYIKGLLANVSINHVRSIVKYIFSIDMKVLHVTYTEI